MAVVLKINPGFDASYPWRQIGAGAQPTATSPLEYFLAPADKGGEPAGRWAGPTDTTVIPQTDDISDPNGLDASVDALLGLYEAVILEA